MDLKPLLSELELKMDKAIKSLEHDLRGLRTGRASVNLLDPVHVEAYGSRMPISQLATVTVPDARMLNVQVWDKSMVKAVEKAISDANLGLNPATDGQNIRLPIPPLNQERRKELAKLAGKYGENAKIAIRNIRRDGMDDLKKLEKDKQISEDELHSVGEEVQKLTDKEISNIDKIVKAKEHEISSI
ncbi:MAG: ribosome recycling factor [Rickettsiaceae bacterium]|nr:ribosome recycling factor [Rickettsiaceae bacterium]